MLKVAEQTGEFVLISTLESFGHEALLRKRKRKLSRLVKGNKKGRKGNQKLCLKSRRKKPNFSSLRNEKPKQTEAIKQVRLTNFFKLSNKMGFQVHQMNLLSISFLENRCTKSHEKPDQFTVINTSSRDDPHPILPRANTNSPGLQNNQVRSSPNSAEIYLYQVCFFFILKLTWLIYSLLF